MDKIEEYIQRFEVNTGIRTTYEHIDNVSDLPMYIEKQFTLLRVTLLDVPCIVLFSESVPAKVCAQAVNSVKKNNKNVALFIHKPRLAEKKFFLFHKIPFFSSDGEMYLPFLGARLYPFNTIKSLEIRTLSSSAQEIFVLLFYLVKHMEKNGQDKMKFYDSPIDIYGKQLMFTGGQEFIDYFGKYISIKNRVTLARALNELESQAVISSKGKTKSKKYFIMEDSYNLLLKNKDILQSPLYTQKFYIDKNMEKDFSSFFNKIDLITDSVKVGDTALSHFSMISAPNYLEISLYKKNNMLLKKILEEMRSEYYIVSHNCEYVLEFSKHDLNRFNKLYRDMIDPLYPEDIIDPLNLYLSRMNDGDERVIDNINALIISKLK